MSLDETNEKFLIFRILSLLIRSLQCALIFNRHSDSKSTIKDGKGFSSTEDDIADVYPLQLRLSVQKETNSFGVRISKKVSLPLFLPSFFALRNDLVLEML